MSKTNTDKKPKTIVVGIPLYQDCTLMDFAGAAQVFAFAQGFKPILLANEVITTTEGVIVQPNYSLSKHPKIDLLFVPGGGSDGVSSAMQDKAMLGFLKRTAKTATWCGSVCTGAFILAAAGLLHDTKATTYWSQLPTLRLLKDKMKLNVPQDYPRYIINKKKKTFTGGGISSSVDLSLELVRTILNKRQAELTQLSIQYQPHPSTNAGDPAHAPKSVTAQTRKEQVGFTEAMVKATEKLLI
jgi:cyclohexyl-isocyanide hydratase